MARDLIVAPRGVVLPVGMKGRASLSFDGVDDVLVGSHGCTGDADVTFGGWIRVGLVRSSFDVVASVGEQIVDHGFYGGYSTAAGWNVSIHGRNGATHPRKPLSGEWVHFVAEYNKTTKRARIWLDTVPGTDTAIVASPSPAFTSHLRIGAATVNFAKCCWWDFRTFNGLLSQAQIEQWFRGEPVTGTGSTVDTWLKCEDGYGSTVLDYSGNNRTATIVGALWSPDVPFRRRRVVEDVAAAASLRGVTCTVSDHANLQPGAGSFGLMGWLRIDSFAAGRILLHKAIYSATYRGPVIYQASGSLRALIGDNAAIVPVDSAFRIAEGTGWTHVALCRDTSSGLLLLHVNAGRPASASAAAIGSIDSAANLAVAGSVGGDPGARESANDLLWRKGAPFTWEEIEAHYYDGIVPTAPAGSTQIRWGMREGSGTTIASDPAGYNGTLSAASWTTSTRSKARDAAAARDAA
jgi:hypothetical protein